MIKLGTYNKKPKDSNQKQSHKNLNTDDNIKQVRTEKAHKVAEYT